MEYTILLCGAYFHVKSIDVEGILTATVESKNRQHFCYVYRTGSGQYSVNTIGPIFAVKTLNLHMQSKQL